MSLDISALLGGDNAPDLGDALSSRTSRGDLVFSKPFGDTTKWRTDTGYVTVTVIFDPFLPWARDNLLSSTTPNYISNIRRRLGEHLVPDAMTDEEDSWEALRWAAISAALPAKALHSYLTEGDGATQNARLHEYLAVLLKTTEKQYKEDKALHKALSTSAFDFTYHLAVDMYPQDSKENKASAGTGNATRREKRGVLVFNVQGVTGVPVNSEQAKVGVDALDPAEDSSSPKPKSKHHDTRKRAPSVAEEEDENHADRPPMRKLRTAHSKKQQKELEQLLDRLELNEDRLAASHCVWIKKFPKTADAFFEQVGSWFDCLLQRKQAQFERDGEATNTGLYV